MFDFEDFGADLCVDAKGQLSVYSFRQSLINQRERQKIMNFTGSPLKLHLLSFSSFRSSENHFEDRRRVRLLQPTYFFSLSFS